MLPCEIQQCAYRKSIPGDRHSQCCRRFLIREILPILTHMTKLPPQVWQWFIFPYNYDPCWGPDECLGFSDTIDPDKVYKFDADEKLLSLLGKRMR